MGKNANERVAGAIGIEACIMIFLFTIRFIMSELFVNLYLNSVTFDVNFVCAYQYWDP